MAIFNLFLAVHAADVAGDEIHWARAEKRHHGNHIGQFFGLHLDQPTAHPVAFHLKDAQCIPFAKQFISRRVFQGDIVEAQVEVMPFANQITGARHDRQSGQSKKVHLKQADRLDDAHFELRHRLDRRFV